MLEWREWFLHFENVAAVNSCDNAQEMKWLRVRLTGGAQMFTDCSSWKSVKLVASYPTLTTVQNMSAYLEYN